MSQVEAMTTRSGRVRGTSGRLSPRAAGLGLCIAMLAGATGCTNWDSFMDPSVVGRWEHTPTKVPILEHIATIEEPEAEFVETSEISPRDLLPETEVYRVGPGDQLDLTIFDLIIRGQPENLPRVVDQNGYIEIPQLGRIWVNGLTETEVTEAIKDRMQNIIRDPDVSVVVRSRRQATFNVMGAVAGPGPYFIPASDYRLLEALAAAGGVNENIEEVFVIRQVPLTSEAAGIAPEGGPQDGQPAPSGQKPAAPQGEDILDIIDELSQPAPGVVGGVDSGYGSVLMPGTIVESQPDSQPEREPLIDLVDPNAAPQPAVTQPAPGASKDGIATRWIFVNGQWVLAQTPAGVEPTTPQTQGASKNERDEFLREASRLMTQRVIRVPVRPLVTGDARYNIIVRPGDILRVPPPPQGNIYIDGEVARPGVYQLPGLGGLTLKRAITAAGGFSPIAIPERVDLTRMVGHDQQATIMLDFRAIAEGTQPDIYLKANDQINVGTNFWATPLAIVRNGLRATYGFGFLLDRNFGNDVFGAPPGINR
ncbi:MAG: polysaccharide biosynthesis/export family protein [Phycisphaerales bacterium]